MWPITPYESEQVRRDGKVVVRYKGTLSILDDWIHEYFRPVDWGPIDEMMSTFREVRTRRQRPAHAIDENVFDQEYFREQRDLIERTYGAIRTLRLLLANYPEADQVEIPQILEELIWDGGVEVKQGGDTWYIERDSLHDLREC